jgi:hypothetical protein
MNITITLPGGNPKEAFEAGSFWREYALNCSKCGCCGSERVIPTHRVVVPQQGQHKGKRLDYYEAACLDCGGRFPFGQKQDAEKSLFPKRDKGWAKFSKDGDSGSQSHDGDSSEPPF